MQFYHLWLTFVKKMVKNSIKVYARVRRANDKSKIGKYEICAKPDHQEIEFRNSSNTAFRLYKNSKLKYRFNSIFDQNSSQTDIFDNVATPVINSVLQGYNGTIFAYGQTGSGKTYSITGSSEYDTRGIIPRTIHHIFEHVENNTNVLYNIYISYLEIYNEVGYDLLNPKHRATNLEDLPRVTILEDAKGEIHLRNLNVIPVASEREAMCLLFLGDTNRTIAETPMNAYSSRSHCIFTVHVAATMTANGVVRRSKLHLVDLAGSERIHKTNISGSMLVDAKQINLSLHYLEQVITALSDTKRAHVPYRNSVMTTVLRDSLGGNCLTAMLATLSVEIKNFEETISTCKFSQRVALVSSDAFINEEEDPELEINRLRTEIEILRNELNLYKTNHNAIEYKATEISPRKLKEYEKAVKYYLENSNDDFPMPLDQDISKIHNYFKVLKTIILSQQEIINQKPTKQKATQATMTAEIKKYEDVIQQKNSEISILINLLDSKSKKVIQADDADNISYDYLQNNLPVSLNKQLPSNQNYSEALAIFLKTGEGKNQLPLLVTTLKQKYQIAKNISNRIMMCKQNIVNIKKRIRENINNIPENSNQLILQLKSQQDIYRENILYLQKLKTDVDHVYHSLEQEKVKLLHKFNQWRLKEKQTEVQFGEILLKNHYSVHNNSDNLRDVTDNPLSILMTKDPLHYSAHTDSYISPISKLNRKAFSEERIDNGFGLDDCNKFHNNDFIFCNYTDYDITPQEPAYCQTNLEDTFDGMKQFSNNELPSHIPPISNNQVQTRLPFTMSNRPLTVPFDENQRRISSPEPPLQLRSKENIPNNKYRNVSQENYKYQSKNVTPRDRGYTPDTFPEKLENNIKITEKLNSSYNEQYPTNVPNSSKYYFCQENLSYSNFSKQSTSYNIDENQKTLIQTEPSQIEEYYNLKGIPLTGDPEVDEEIIAFYKAQDSIVKSNK